MSMSATHALVVDDDRDIRRMLSMVLTREGIQVTEAEDGDSAVRQLHRRLPDVMLLDVKMPRRDGMDVLRDVRGRHPDLPVVMMTAFAGVNGAIEAIRCGAVDYLPKPFDNRNVVRIVKRALASREPIAANDAERSPASPANRASLSDWLAQSMGPSAAIRHLADELAAVVATDFSVVIQGETGTGKELIARTIHRFSHRASGPFVAVDCGAIPESLLENELFGHEKGAFTGADRRELGRFEAAAGGTLFLDELANLPLPSQAALLRVLQERTVVRVGGHSGVDIDVRVVVASNEDLAEAVQAGRFRQDLWYRLSEFQVRLPALRERRDDILHLAEQFRRQAQADLNRPVPPFASSAKERLLSFDWPGNVRELRLVVRRAALLAEHEITDEQIRVRSRPRQEADRAADSEDVPLGRASLREIVQDSVNRIERRVLVKALRQCRGNKAEAARLLRIDYKTIYNKLKKFGITPAETGYG
jgi:two-component system nitrogen regulation response regulator GlnG